ncbi:Hypothetical protein LOCK908_1663 [Lacticaseibacillus rhamnosus LOCK908]|uniref:Uncharacterized protein n=1 Tax=Lacticaseibacillus rhamnosus (strain LMS2-1) TaxID=525361 RepID=C2JXQ0_LACRM|nr:hypothetical protein LRHK_1598 [Lacticaseibacillus rhamnosus ATCC 8530]AGP74301.1 Hypothetical protein LOCK908_1663 [Lacticaseibacillus rhamnosus LOCK908]EEN80138.1 hypothetical protein HMPREF0539_1685 [Lacticaseibacillus rhamnosus LMS2-1]
MAKAQPSRLRPLTLRLLTTPARAQQKKDAATETVPFSCH